MKRHRLRKTRFGLDVAKLAARRLRDEITAPLCETLCRRFNELKLGRPWHSESNPALKREGELLVRCFSVSAGLEIIVSISATVAGLEIVVNVDRLNQAGRLSHVHHTSSLAEIEAGGEWMYQQIRAAGESVIRTLATPPDQQGTGK